MSDWNSCQKSLNIQKGRSGAVGNRGWTKIGVGGGGGARVFRKGKQIMIY